MESFVYVTDAGSISAGGHLYKPGSRIPARLFKDKTVMLRQLLASGQLSTRPTGIDETAITYKRSSGAEPLPSEVDLYDPKKKRLLNPIQSSVKNQHEIHASLEDLKKNQQAREEAEAREKAEKAREEPKSEPVEEPLSEEEQAELEALIDEVDEEMPLSEEEEAAALLEDLENDEDEDLDEDLDEDDEDEEE